MFLALEDVLSGPEARTLRAAAADLDFQDGAATAGRMARQVKANAQAAPSPARDAVLAKARAALLAHPVLGSAARPRQMGPLLLSRYREGQTYGTHVDDALMGGLRADLSVTLFLSDPATYAGGELIVEDPFEARAVKLDAGHAFLYPSSTLHRVAPVISGERLAVVGWIESWIRDLAAREVLFDLDRALAEVEVRDGKSHLWDTLAKARSNLIRRWAGA